jgi:hypothetical protein
VWPGLAALVQAYPMDIRDHDAGVTILGAPIGDNSYVMQYFDDKFASIDLVFFVFFRLMSQMADIFLIQKMSAICDMRLAFHAHRLCATRVNLSMASA